MIPKVRTNYLRTVAPTLSIRTFQYLRNALGFGDWLLLIMMSHNLDVKLFTDILAEIGMLIIQIYYRADRRNERNEILERSALIG